MTQSEAAIVVEGVVREEYAGEGPVGGDITYFDVHDAEGASLLWGELAALESKRVRVTIEVLP